MSNEPIHFTVEKRILVAMRKTLSNVVKDVTPSSAALKSPLSDATVEDIKMCFGLIAAREQELAKEAGVKIKERPQYPDEPTKSNVVSLDSLKSTTNKES
ncbi:MAG TPA: segregation and condensation protein A [Leucothrix sp.]|nr:segregation and condensation protein A [Leucothrix sp.]